MSGFAGKKRKNKLGIFGILVVVVVMGVVLYSGIDKSTREVEELKDKQEKLQNRLEEEKTRTEQLEEKRVYVTTKKYVEEIAKQLGLVYPNEIIYKPTD